MKAFIIYVQGNKISETYAAKTLDSFNSNNGWEPTLFKGVKLSTLSYWKKQYPLQMKKLSRVASFHTLKTKTKYNTKKCCSMNHYRLFQKCVKINEPIAVIEHDSYCKGNWLDVDFDDVLILNAQSAIHQKAFTFLRKQYPNTEKVEKGIHDINFELYYRHDPEINGANIMPGTAAYAITPTGAQKMIDVYENIGWEQSDFIINTHYVRIQTIIPELFTFKVKNLSMSHGGDKEREKRKKGKRTKKKRKN